MEQDPKLWRNIAIGVGAGLLVEGVLRLLDAARINLVLAAGSAVLVYFWLRALSFVRAKIPSPIIPERTIPQYSKALRLGSFFFLIAAPAVIALAVLIRTDILAISLQEAPTEAGYSRPTLGARSDVPTSSPSPEIARSPTPQESAELTAPAPTGTPTAEPGATTISSSDGIALVFIPAGKYLIGSATDVPRAEAQEFPAHEVDVGAFWIDKTEVTNSMYQECVADRLIATPESGGELEGCRPHAGDLLPGSGVAYYENDRFGSYPVINVSWFAAKEYCEWAGRRLPTELEWEAAARGLGRFLYPWGDSPSNPELANYAHSGSEPRVPLRVGLHPHGSGPFSIFDMAGNVWEWTDSWFDPYPGSTYTSDEYGASSRVIRGGSYASWGFLLRASVRRGMEPDKWSQQVGFRCALSHF